MRLIEQSPQVRIIVCVEYMRIDVLFAEAGNGVFVSTRPADMPGSHNQLTQDGVDTTQRFALQAPEFYGLQFMSGCLEGSVRL